MQFNKLLSDDDAVSPVIGVILMVAITVILAAVIASFVLGIGDQQEVQPQAQFDWEYDSASNNVTLTHSSGESIDNKSIIIRGDGLGDHSNTSSPDWSERDWVDPKLDDDSWNGTASGNVDGTSAIVSGDSVTIDVTGDAWDLRLVWESSSGGTTATLTQESGPGA